MPIQSSSNCHTCSTSHNAQVAWFEEDLAPGATTTNTTPEGEAWKAQTAGQFHGKLPTENPTCRPFDFLEERSSWVLAALSHQASTQRQHRKTIGWCQSICWSSLASLCLQITDDDCWKRVYGERFLFLWRLRMSLRHRFAIYNDAQWRVSPATNWWIPWRFWSHKNNCNDQVINELRKFTLLTIGHPKKKKRKKNLLISKFAKFPALTKKWVLKRSPNPPLRGLNGRGVYKWRPEIQ